MKIEITLEDLKSIITLYDEDRAAEYLQDLERFCERAFARYWNLMNPHDRFDIGSQSTDPENMSKKEEKIDASIKNNPILKESRECYIREDCAVCEGWANKLEKGQTYPICKYHHGNEQ